MREIIDIFHTHTCGEVKVINKSCGKESESEDEMNIFIFNNKTSTATKQSLCIKRKYSFIHDSMTQRATFYPTSSLFFPVFLSKS